MKHINFIHGPVGVIGRSQALYNWPNKFFGQRPFKHIFLWRSQPVIASSSAHRPRPPYPIMPAPDLPILPADNSLLSQKFGRETINYFSGSPLNRVSFLRNDQKFLQAAFGHPQARFLLMNNLAPLVHASDTAQLAFATNADVTVLAGTDPFAKTEEEMIRDYDSEEERALIVFLGINETGELPLNDSEAGEPFTYKEFKGAPYFAIDVTPRGKLADAAKALIKAMKAKGYVFYDSSPRHMGLRARQGK